MSEIECVIVTLSAKLKVSKCMCVGDNKISKREIFYLCYPLGGRYNMKSDVVWMLRM